MFKFLKVRLEVEELKYFRLNHESGISFQELISFSNPSNHPITMKSKFSIYM